MIVFLIQAALVISSFAAPPQENPAVPVLPNGSPTTIGNTGDVIWADSSASSDIFNSVFSLWNPATGELKKFGVPKGFFLFKAARSTTGLFLLGSEANNPLQKIVFTTLEGKAIITDLPFGQSSLHLIVLKDQSALVVGGELISPKRFTREVQRIVVENGSLKIERLPDVPSEVSIDYALVALNDGRVMILGGSNEEYMGCEFCVADTFILDIKTKTWSKGPRMLEPRSDATATLLPDESVLVAGGWTPGHGWNSDEASRSTERWLPKENRFISDNPLPIGVARHQLTWAAGQQGRHLLLMGGMSKAWHGNDAILDYEVSTGIWRTIGKSPIVNNQDGRLRYAGTLIFNNQMYLWIFNYQSQNSNTYVALNMPSSSQLQSNLTVAEPKGTNAPHKYQSNIPADLLLTATNSGNAAKVLWLVSQGADVNAMNNEGSTLLMLANHYFDIKTIQSLIDSGADINAKNKDGTTDLMLAIQSGRTDVVRALFIKDVNVNVKDKDGKTALMFALENNQLDALQMLLAKGADVNMEAKDGTTALMLASPKGHLDVVQALLDKGADVNARNSSGKTALMFASEKGQVEVVQALLAKGADAEIKMSDGTNALMLASNNSHPDVVQVFKAKGAKVNAKSNNHVINIVQLDRYSGKIGNHPVQVALGNTDTEISGHYHYGLHNGDDKLILGGSKDTEGAWKLQESIATTEMNAQPKQTGQWVLKPVADGWKGTWKKMDGSGELPVTLYKEWDAADYATVSYLNNDPKVRPNSPACVIRVFRHQHLAETIDASNDTEDCQATMLSFPDLNFDGHADMIYNIDTPAHNFSFSLMLYEATKQYFVNAGILTEPEVDPIHKNIFVTVHYSAGAHSAAIYRFQKGKSEPTLIDEMIPCSSRNPKIKEKSGSCFENYIYDMRSGEIVGEDAQ